MTKDVEKEMPAEGLRHVALEWPSGIHIIKKGLVGAARKICQDGAWSFFMARNRTFCEVELGQ